jgi:tripartite-type tricarboxylate transporter receptor subunit TctC
VTKFRISAIPTWAAAGLCLASAAFSAAPAAANQVADFYSGRTIRLIQCGGVGGSYAIYTRILADQLGRHIPGHPRLVVEYMEGGGGLKGENYLYNAAPKDGSVLAMPESSIVLAPLLYPKAAKFDPVKFVWIGNMTRMQTVIGVWKTSPATTLEQAKARQDTIGSTGKTSELTLTPLLLNKTVGTKFKIVKGYHGVGAINLAMEKGEVNGRSGGWSAWEPMKPDWFHPAPKVVLLAQLGLSKLPMLPDVPLVTSFARNEQQREVLELMSRSTILTRAVAAPPKTPMGRATALRAAFAATMKDPAFLAEMKKHRMLMIEPMTWQQIDAFLAKTAATPKSVVVKFQRLLGVEG